MLSSTQLIEREYSIGDIYYDKNNKPVGYGSYYRVGYLDGSKKHGIAYKVFEGKDKWPVQHDSNLGAHVPTIRQMQLLWVNRKELGLYGEYWSCDRGPATQQYEKHYLMKAFDFYIGKTIIRNSAT
ncbi:MAG: hypothetical protein J6W82_09535 [Bacteroidales bacterium]|nr:hypothetical protein [Bacteroidales bacterium]